MIELIVKSEIELEYAELICEAVEDIRKEGGAQWSYWGSAKHILDFFDEKSCECVESILERAIQSNGASVEDDLAAAHQLVWHNEQPSQEKMYQHKISGDVASESDWKDDFDGMDVESWFGFSDEECEGLHWLNDSTFLVEVKRDENYDWVEA